MSTSPHSNATLAYYDRHADRYAADTVGADMSCLYAPFLDLLPAGGRILDAGCGSGRDALAFHRSGYQVTAFDGSVEMARVARKGTGLPVAVLTFDMVEYGPEFDGVWACASLLHVPRGGVPDVLSRLVRALKPGGVLYVSFKDGESQGERGGRWFTDYTADGLRAELSAVAGLEDVRVWVTADVRPGRGLETWVNALARRNTID